MLTSPTRPLWCSPGVVVPLLSLIGGIVNVRGDGSRDFDLNVYKILGTMSFE